LLFDHIVTEAGRSDRRGGVMRTARYEGTDYV
jgi:hypothetical protein